MPDDDDIEPHHATARPPPGEEDVYSASTVVGAASEQILAIIRESGQSPKAVIPAAPAIPAEAKASTTEKATPLEVPITPPADDVAKADDPEPAAHPPASEKEEEREEAKEEAEEEAEEEAPKPLATTSHAPAPAKEREGLPPALGIVLFFVVVVIALVALVR